MNSPDPLVDEPSSTRHGLKVALLATPFLLAALALSPIASRALPAVPQVSGLFGLVVGSSELLTAFLLASIAAGHRPRWLVRLTCAYLFSGAMALLHALTFPGAMLPAGSVLGTTETVAWLYVTWQVGFSGLLLLSASTAVREYSRGMPSSGGSLRVAVPATLVGTFVAFAAARWMPWPAYFAPGGTGFGLWAKVGGGATIALSLVTTVVVWRHRRICSRLVVWLALVAAVTGAGFALGLVGGARYSAGWYASRALVAAGSAMVLIVLLHELLRSRRALRTAAARLGEQAQALQAEVHRRERAERMFVQAQKLEAVGQLAGGVAHDFNNLLQVMRLRLELLRRQAPPESQPHVAILRDTVGRAERLTSHLLSLTGRRSLTPEVLDVGTWLPRHAKVLSALVRDDVRIEIDVDPDVGRVHVDGGELEAALLNLVSNARDAMPSGGRVVVSAKARPPSDGDAAIVFTVSDEGEGIEPEVLDRLGEPFFTTKEPGKGTGLGLAQVHALARRSGGSVTIESRPGAGTAVSIVLPRARAASPDAPASGTPGRAEPAAGRGALIMIVDDNAEVGRATGALLEQAGYTVTLVESAREALERLAAGTRPRAVVSDVVMGGGMDGIALARRMRERHPELPVILCTGYSASSDQARDEGFTVLAKPYEAQSLEAALRAALDGGRVAAEAQPH
ncbi:MAG TPA: ATP-binding protein [Burkholderiaceae bacterium]|nr:ATP-binding protein [Burkholderiaceae bacterium]